jgi:hypothetical protein
MLPRTGRSELRFVLANRDHSRIYHIASPHAVITRIGAATTAERQDQICRTKAARYPIEQAR